MKWNKYTIETTTAAEDYFSSGLGDLGIEGVQIEDNVPLTKEDQAEMFIDFLPELPPDEGISYVSFYVEDNGQNDAELLKQVKTTIEKMRKVVDMGTGKITSDQTEDIDWINNWKQYFHQFYIDDILVIPSWENIKPEDTDKMVLHIDPGTAFGTGMHETTQLCIRQLRKFITSETELLDVGTGSGILAISSVLLGCDRAVGVEIDPTAVRVAEENSAINHTDDRVQFICGDLVQKVEGVYDIVCANIVADVIIQLLPNVGRFMAEDAVLITSGIIDEREADVQAALAQNGFAVGRRRESAGWVALECAKEK